VKITKKKYLGANKNVQMDMLWYLLRETELLVLLGIVLLAFIKWG